MRILVALIFPFTSNASPGLEVPIPTLPTLVILILSAAFVLVTKSTASVVPIKFVPAVEPLLPVLLHAVEVMADEISRAVAAVPFTVVVKFVPDKLLLTVVELDAKLE